MTAETLRHALLANITTWTIASPHWEDDAELVYGYIAHDLDTLLAAVRAEEAAKGLTVEALAEVLRWRDPENRPWWLHIEGAVGEREFAVTLAALTPTPPPPAATVDGTDWWAISRALNDLIEKRRPTHGFGDILAPADIRDAVLGTLPRAATVERCAECGRPRADHDWEYHEPVDPELLGHPFTPAPEPK
jgi:hypothetical protein